MKNLLRKMLTQLVKVSDIEMIRKEIDTYPVISFDIFDTLLRREVNNPSDIFTLVEQLYNDSSCNSISGFKQMRIIAERKARKQSLTEETDLFSIYALIPLEKGIKDKLMKMELEVERKQLTAKSTIYRLYNYAYSKRKEVLIISDMYLPLLFIKDSLAQNGYIGYNHLYLSSEVGVRKATGNMFRYVLNETGFRPSDILHIGDSFKSDWLMPRKYGIKSCLI